MNKSKIEQLIKIINLPLELGMDEYLNNEKNNWFYYFHNLNLISKEELESIYNREKAFEYNKYLYNFWKSIDYLFCQDIEGEVIADVGAGWGHVSFWMLLNGVKKVYSIGDPFRSKFIKELFLEAKKRKLLPEDSELEVIGEWVEEGHTILANCIDKEELDRCVFIDVFEHIPFHRMPSLIQSCAYNLKQGGKIISTTHNTNSPRVLNEVMEYWDNVEENKEIIARSVVLREVHKVEDEKTISLLARNTRGLVRKEFDEAIEIYKKEGILPVYNSKAPTYDVYTDEAHEGPTDYNFISSIMRKKGFKTSVYPTTYGSRKTRWLQPIAKIIPLLFLSMHILDDDICFYGVKK